MESELAVALGLDNKEVGGGGWPGVCGRMNLYDSTR